MDCRWRSSAVVRVSPVSGGDVVSMSFWDGVAERMGAELLNERSRGVVGVVPKGRRAR